VLNRDPKRHAHTRMARDVDYDILGPSESPRQGGPGVVFGNGRPAHLDRNNRRPAFARDID
jgi:hypothetical protein